MPDSVSIAGEFARNRVWMGAVYLVLCSLALTANLLLVVAFARTWRWFRRFPFFLLAMQLVAADLCALLSQLLIAVPTTLWNGTPDALDAYLAFPVMRALILMDSVAFNASLLFAFAACLNRFFILFWQRAAVCFEKPFVFVWIAVIWLYVLAISLLSNVLGCVKLFDTTRFFFYFRCETDASFGLVVNDVARYSSYVIPVVMLLLYLRTFLGFEERFAQREFRGTEVTSEMHPVSVTNRSKQTSGSGDVKTAVPSIHKSRERSMLVQGVLICAIIEVETFVFTVVPQLARLAGVDSSPALSAIQNCITILYNCANAVIMFYYNQHLRRELGILLRIVRQCAKRDVNQS